MPCLSLCLIQIFNTVFGLLSTPGSPYCNPGRNWEYALTLRTAVKPIQSKNSLMGNIPMQCHSLSFHQIVSPIFSTDLLKKEISKHFGAWIPLHQSLARCLPMIDQKSKSFCKNCGIFWLSKRLTSCCCYTSPYLDTSDPINPIQPSLSVDGLSLTLSEQGW